MHLKRSLCTLGVTLHPEKRDFAPQRVTPHPWSVTLHPWGDHFAPWGVSFCTPGGHFAAPHLPAATGGSACPHGSGGGTHSPWLCHGGKAHLRCWGGWRHRIQQSPRGPRWSPPSLRGSSPPLDLPCLPPSLPGNLPKHRGGGYGVGVEPEGEKNPVVGFISRLGSVG